MSKSKKPNKQAFFPSECTIGGKIRKIRKIRGLTQKELGIKCGFPDNNADIRIRQYEIEDVIPKNETLKKIADILEINVESLYNADFLSLDRMSQVLFDMEELHGLHPTKNNETIQLEFSGHTNRGELPELSYDAFLNDWYKAYMKYRPDIYDSDDEKKKKHDKYLIWKYNYTNYNRQNMNSENNTSPEFDILQAEYDKLFTETNSKKELDRINEVLKDELSKSKKEYLDIESISPFWYQIILLVRLGATIEHQSPENPLLMDSTKSHVISIKASEITNDCIFLNEIAKLFCEIDTLNKKGIDLNREITSHKKELFLSFKVSTKNYYYFSFLDEHWNEIELLKGSIYKSTIPGELTNSTIQAINEALTISDIPL